MHLFFINCLLLLLNSLFFLFFISFCLADHVSTFNVFLMTWAFVLLNLTTGWDDFLFILYDNLSHDFIEYCGQFMAHCYKLLFYSCLYMQLAQFSFHTVHICFFVYTINNVLLFRDLKEVLYVAFCLFFFLLVFNFQFIFIDLFHIFF